MGRIVAIDYGSKRVGIAETDDLKIISSPLTTVHSTEVIQFLLDYHQKYNIEVLVIGEPKRLNNTATDSTKMIDEFAVHAGRKLKEVPIVRIDERFTSTMARQTMHMAGATKKQKKNKGLVDAISASIILQSYLDQQASGFHRS
jgi:putative Holliday junction resolvase